MLVSVSVTNGNYYSWYFLEKAAASFHIIKSFSTTVKLVKTETQGTGDKIPF